MKNLFGILLLASLVFAPVCVFAQPGGRDFDAFKPISKYITLGDAERLSAWFADNLEVSIASSSIDSSKNQAKQILKSFFDQYTPNSFEITHTAGKGEMKYALGTLKAGGETFMVTVFIGSTGRDYKIQQLRIDRMR